MNDIRYCHTASERATCELEPPPTSLAWQKWHLWLIHHRNHHQMCAVPRRGFYRPIRPGITAAPARRLPGSRMRRGQVRAPASALGDHQNSDAGSRGMSMRSCVCVCALVRWLAKLARALIEGIWQTAIKSRLDLICLPGHFNRKRAHKHTRANTDALWKSDVCCYRTRNCAHVLP